MSISFLLLRNVHETVHVLTIKLNYSEPKIYTGGVDISTWSQLTMDQLQKLWDLRIMHKYFGV
jgi:hypothetical protein